jgi:large subunit ribosomal protein L25
VSEVKLPAVPRTEFGKGAARRLRRAHQVPAVVYGHGTDPVHVSLPGHETMLALKQHNALLTLEIDGSPTLTLPKAIQRDPIKGWIEHVDLLIVKRGEKVTVDVPVHVSGEAAPETLVVTEHSTVQLEAEATAIPERIEVSVEGAAVGTQIHASDLALPEGTTLLTSPEALIVNVTQAQTAEQLEAELAEAEAEAGIVHEESDEAIEAAAAEAAEGEAAEGEAAAEGSEAPTEGDSAE